MKFFFRRYILCFLIFLSVGYAQNQQLADSYFKNGEFGKAYVYYDKLLKENEGRFDVLMKMTECKQQLELYTEAGQLLENYMKKYSNPVINVVIGYNYQLQKKIKKAEVYYNKAIAQGLKNTGYVYTIGLKFEDLALIDQAIEIYEKANKISPHLNLGYMMARVYGEKGNMEKMFVHYIEYLERNRQYKYEIRRLIGPFLTEDRDNKNNRILRKILLLKSQKEPDVLWNDMLAWLFIKQKEYSSAFLQYKAIFNREKQSRILEQILQLAGIVNADNNIDIATEIYTYLTQTDLRQYSIKSHLELIRIRINKKEQLSEINKTYKSLLDNFGKRRDTAPIYESYSRFLAYKMNDFSAAEQTIKTAFNFSYGSLLANLKITLGDIYVYYEKYNKALIYYAQVEQDMKNSELGQKALFKGAQVSFFRGDFDWAESQLDALKSASSQFIANDALQLKWLIKDNLASDSLQIPLKKYARATLLEIQNQQQKAIVVLDTLLKNYMGNDIEDDALLKQAMMYESQKKYKAAQANYKKIIKYHTNDILIDDALFRLAKINELQFQNFEEAKRLYERIVIDHPDSIYYVDSRKRFRKLRGDTSENL